MADFFLASSNDTVEDSVDSLNETERTVLRCSILLYPFVPCSGQSDRCWLINMQLLRFVISGFTNALRDMVMVETCWVQIPWDAGGIPGIKCPKLDL